MFEFDFALQCIIEFFAATILTLIVVFNVDPIFSALLFGVMFWIAKPISGGYFTPVNALFAGIIQKRHWMELLTIIVSQFLGGGFVYMLYMSGGLDYI